MRHEAASKCSKELLEGAQAQLRRMQRYFLVEEFEFRPTVYLKVTSNWVELTLRYLVEPKKRRSAQNFIYSEVFKRVQGRKDISIASETMDLTVHRESSSNKEADKAA